MSRNVADVDWSLRQSAARIRFYRLVGDARSLEIEMAVVDRLLDERNRLAGVAAATT